MQYFTKYPNAAVIVSSFFWGTFWIPLRYLNETGEYSVWPITFSFIILSAVLIYPLIKSIRMLFYHKDVAFFLGNFFSALAIALYSESFLRGEVATVVILFYLCPVWGTLLAKIILRQHFNFQRYVSLILGIIGLEVILGFDKGNFIPTSIAEIMALAAGFTWAMGMTLFHLSKTTKGIEKTAFTSL